MTTFVLVHGSYQGGWIWSRVAKGLRAKGHLVHHPTLDGCAERAHALRADISLKSHGAEIAQFLFYEDVRDGIIVGASSGGMVVAQAAEEAQDRIARLVFIDALVPMPGERVAEINGRPPHAPEKLTYSYPPDEIAGRAFYGVSPPELRAWAAARYTPHPRAPTEEPVDLRKFWSADWRGRVDVLRCRGARLPPPDHQRRIAEQLHGRYSEIDAGHYPMLTHPDELVDYLTACSSGEPLPASIQQMPRRR